MSIIEESASVNSRKGHTNTIRIRGAGAEDDLERSETSRCRAVAAIAKSIRARAGIHLSLIHISEPTRPERSGVSGGGG